QPEAAARTRAASLTLRVGSGVDQPDESEAMKTVEYRGMSDEQLALALKDLVKNLFHLRFQSATDRLETPSEIRKAKREVARIKTIQRERELQKQKPAGLRA